MKKFIETLQAILPFMKNPDDYAPCQCSHDVLYIWGVDFTRMKSEDVKKIVELGFYPGFEDCDFIEYCFVFTCMLVCCRAIYCKFCS